jgi:dCTP deaminase
MLSASAIAERLSAGAAHDDPLVITPEPELEDLRRSGSASVDLRLGTWFSSLRATKMAILDVRNESAALQKHVIRMAYVPFDRTFILHPHTFVLAVTLEWIRLPRDLVGDVVGKSAWGRHGLTVATATGVHPGFFGCLTLELSNIGEIPIRLYPGVRICQLFLQEVNAATERIEAGGFAGHRRPVFGAIKVDEFAQRLATSSE